MVPSSADGCCRASELAIFWLLAADPPDEESLPGPVLALLTELKSYVDEHGRRAATIELSTEDAELIAGSLTVEHPADGIDAKKLAPQLEGLGWLETVWREDVLRELGTREAMRQAELADMSCPRCAWLSGAHTALSAVTIVVEHEIEKVRRRAARQPSAHATVLQRFVAAVLERRPTLAESWSVQEFRAVAASLCDSSGERMEVDGKGRPTGKYVFEGEAVSAKSAEERARKTSTGAKSPANHKCAGAHRIGRREHVTARQDKP